MKTKLYLKRGFKGVFAIMIVIILSFVNVSAQTAEADSVTYKAYVNSRDYGKAIKLWQDAVYAKTEKVNKNPQNVSLRYELALTQFGLLTAAMRTRDEGVFDKYFESTEDNLEKIIDANRNHAEARALLGSAYGLQLAYSPWKGMFLGPKSSGLIEEALEKNASSPLVQKLYGNSRFFTPETFGGNLKEAAAAYERAIALYENNNRTNNNWFYLDTIVFLGQAYTKLGEHSKAIAAYEKVLSIEPEFAWVKNTLLPQAKKQQ